MKSNRKGKETLPPAFDHHDLSNLSDLRRPAPPDFHNNVMKMLPEHGYGRNKSIGHEKFAWLNLPSLRLVARAAALMVLAMTAFALLYLRVGSTPEGEARPGFVQFHLHAPEAAQVELVGDFTEWQPGRIFFQGPDDSGHWAASVELGEGRYEYLFLVDGKEWVTDLQAPARRPDGFGNLNAIINL